MARNEKHPARTVGVWRAVGEIRLRQVARSEGLGALVVGLGGALAAGFATDVDERIGAAGTALALAGALLAVVFTALAVLVSLSSTSYLRMLNETPQGGMVRFLEPFLVAAGTQIAIIVLAFAYQLAATDVPTWLEQGTFAVLGFLLVFTLLDVVALARSLVRHGILRAEDAALSAEQSENIRPLRRPEHK